MEKERHHGILKEKRVYLVGHLALKDTLVLDQLVQDGVLSSDQLTGMKERCPTNTELASDLVRHLERRPHGDWEKFLRCLSDQKQGHIVGHVSSTLNVCHCSPRIPDLRRLLVAIIQENLDNIPLWTLHSDRVALPMDDIYVNLVMVKDRQRQDGGDEPLRSYKEIFKKIKGRGTIYLTGEPGVGKSTLSKRMCVDWANFIETKVRPADGDKFEQYEFVLLVFLRDVRTDQTFIQVIARAYQLREHEAETLCCYIENTQMPILVILDGIDEYKEETSREITELIHRERYPHVTVFITSRLPSESIYADDARVKCTEVRLEGFSDAGVREYVRKYYDKKKEEGDALLQEIQKSEEMVHLSHYPAILLMMATLWKSINKLASTVTGFYEEFVAYVFARLEKKTVRMANRAKSTKDIFERYHKQIMGLGQLATGNVKTHRLELTFTHDDIIRNIDSEDLRIGFLVGKQTFTRELLYLFIHKTVQEFFLSFFLVHCDKSIQKELLMRFCGSARAFAESAMIRRFITGLGGKEIKEQIETIIKGDETEVAEMHTELQLEYLAEHRDAALALPQYVRLTISSKYAATHYIRYLSQNGQKVQRMDVLTQDMAHWRLLKHLHAPQLTWLELMYRSLGSIISIASQYISETMDSILIRFPLNRFLVNHLIFDRKEISSVLTGVMQIPSLQTLTFYKIRLTGDLVQLLTAWLPGSQIKSLSLLSCYLIPQEVLAVFSSLPPSLINLRVSGNNMTGLALDSEHWASVSHSRLQSLDISSCHMSPLDVLTALDAIPNTLTELDVSGNRWDEKEGNQFVMIMEKAQRLSRLTRLNMTGNRMNDEVKLNIKQKLTELCPNLLVTGLQVYTDTGCDWLMLSDSESETSTEMENETTDKPN